jgi:threonine dehydratase
MTGPMTGPMTDSDAPGSGAATPRSVAIPTSADLARARVALAGVLRPTPLLESPGLGDRVFLKVETALPTASFKPRGTLPALGALGPGTTAIVASAGNAALGMAWAARHLARPLIVVVPETASGAKLAKLRRQPITMLRAGRSFDEAEAAALRLAAKGRGRYVSSYNDTHLIAGYATLGHELADIPPPATVVCPVGGGGLISGLCMWARAHPHVRIVGAEAAASRAMSTAINAGRIVDVDINPTLADGLAGNIERGSVTVEISRARVDAMVAVTEDEIAAAIRYLATEHGLIAEGAGAVATAAVLAGRVPSKGPVVAILSGANISPPLLATVITGETGLAALSKRCRVPGAGSASGRPDRAQVTAGRGSSPTSQPWLRIGVRSALGSPVPRSRWPR